MPNWIHLTKLEKNYSIAVVDCSYGLVVAKNRGLLILISTDIDEHVCKKKENHPTIEGCIGLF